MSFCEGHGGKLRDTNGDEEDGYDETLVPLDFERRGQIRDDDLLKHLVLPMKAGVFVTSVMDCCHSGTVLDLPYNFKADGEEEGMHDWILSTNDVINLKKVQTAYKLYNSADRYLFMILLLFM